MVDDAHGQRPYIHITHYLRLSEGGVTYYSVLTSIVAGRNPRKLESFFFSDVKDIDVRWNSADVFFFFLSFFLVRWGGGGGGKGTMHFVEDPNQTKPT